MAEFCHFHTPDYVVVQNIDKSKYFSIYTSQMSEIVYLGIKGINTSFMFSKYERLEHDYTQGAVLSCSVICEYVISQKPLLPIFFSGCTHTHTHTPLRLRESFIASL